MKRMRSIVPTAAKLKKERERERRTDIFIDGIIEELRQLPAAERQEIVDQIMEMYAREKHG